MTMLTRSFKFVLRSIVGTLFASFLFVSVGHAALSAVQMQTAQQQFMANPGQFLATTDLSPSDLAAVVQALAATPANLPAIIAALASASPTQQNAMGQGLGAAALAAQQSDPAYANQIQTAIATSGSAQASAGYATGSGGVQTASTAGGAAAGGGSGGGGGGPVGSGGGAPSGGGGGGGSAGTGGSQQTGTTGQTSMTSGSSVGGGGGGTGGTNDPVSPR